MTRDQRNEVSKIHLVFKTHLDVGFTDFASRVIRHYVHAFLPAALDLADALRTRGGDERFVWTTGSWLIATALEQSRGAPRRRLEAAIARGDVVWHALPFTTHSELLSPQLFRGGLDLARRLDERFGRRTIAAKMTDVPGHTRGIVPLLADAGVELLHLGVNRASPTPRVPPVFAWRAPDGAEVVVIYASGYGDTTCVAGFDEGLHVEHTEDNVGPPDVASVIATFERLRRLFPAARVEASTLDAFATSLRKRRGALPRVEAEIGDTWIHGAASDPRKLAQLRALDRLCRRWMEEGSPARDAKTLRKLVEGVLLAAEHTWGLDAKLHLANWTDWEGARFRRARARPEFRKMERSWDEQRAVLGAAVRALGANARGREARAALREATPKQTRRDVRVPCRPDALRALRHFEVRIHPRTGAIVGLRARADGRAWADPRHPLAAIVYQTFSARDVESNLARYNANLSDPGVRTWAIPDFGKPGLARAQPLSRLWRPRLRGIHRLPADGVDRFLLVLEAATEARSRYGCPARFEIELEFAQDSPSLAVELRWFEKRATRLPEALWFDFVPRLPRRGRWWLDKMGTRVDPRDVVVRGNRGLHAVQKGVRLEHPRGVFEIETLDAALVSPGRRSLLAFGSALPRTTGGMHFLLQNNVWGTNFPLWYEDDARFRFRVSTPGS